METFKFESNAVSGVCMTPEDIKWLCCNAHAHQLLQRSEEPLADTRRYILDSRKSERGSVPCFGTRWEHRGQTLSEWLLSLRYGKEILDIINSWEPEDT